MIKTHLDIRLIIVFIALYSGLYIFPAMGLRMDHLLIYPSALIFFIFYFFILNRPIILTNDILIILFSFFLINIIGFFSYIFSLDETIKTYEVLADMENYIQPVLLIFLTCFFVASIKDINIDSLIINIVKIFLIFLTINTFVGIALLYIGPNEYLYLIGGPPDAEGKNVTERALGAARSGGFFSQPLDAGIAYSIGMIAWLYLIDKIDSKKAISILSLAQFLIIILGGIVAASKVVYIVGWGLSFLYIFFYSDLYKKLFGTLKLIFISVFFIFFVYLGIENWQGSSGLWRNYQYFIFNRIIYSLS